MIKNNNYFVLKYWKSFALTIIIIILCALPGDEIDEAKFINIPYLDKIVHLGMYFSLSIILMLESIKTSVKRIKTIIILVFIYCFTLGVSIEILQKYIFINRGADIIDVIFNVTGIIFGIFLYLKIKKLKS